MSTLLTIMGNPTYNINKLQGISKSSISKIGGFPTAPLFKFRISKGSPGTFTFPINAGGAGYNHNFIVNWGDGSLDSKVTAYNDSDRTHTYSSSGTYDITMSGLCQYFNFDSPSNPDLTQLLQFTGDLGFQILRFQYCANLATLIPLPYMGDMEQISNMFGHCTGLTSIVTDLFRYNTNVTLFNSIFESCTALTTLPTDLFRYNTLVTNFGSVFKSCTGLNTDIPIGLFSYNTIAVNFIDTFYNCSNIPNFGQPIIDSTDVIGHSTPTDTTSCFSLCNTLTDYNYIPSEWGGGGMSTFKFKVNYGSPGNFTLPINAGGAGYTHNFVVHWGDGSHSTITSYDDADRVHAYAAGTWTVTIEGLCEYFAFQNGGDRSKVTKVLDFNSGFKILNFWGCNNLTSVIPLGTQSALLTFFRMFEDCASLTSLPDHLFDGCNTSLDNFTEVFKGCTSLTTIPADLFKYNTSITSFDSSFFGCSGLTTLPIDLFRYNTAVTNFNTTFDSCSSLTSVPTDLFRYNTSVTTFINTFTLAGLTSIPTDLFRYNTAVTNFSGIFDSCSSLASIPEDVFKYNTAVTNFSGAFQLCTSVTSLPTNLFKFNTLVTNFSSVFNGCTGINTAIPGNIFLFNLVAVNFFTAFYNDSNMTGTGQTIVNNTALGGHSAPTSTQYCFFGCTSLSDYATLPSGWK